MSRLANVAKMPCLSLSNRSLSRSLYIPHVVSRPCFASATSKQQLESWRYQSSWTRSRDQLASPVSSRTTRTYAVQPNAAAPSSLTDDGALPTVQQQKYGSWVILFAQIGAGHLSCRFPCSNLHRSIPEICNTIPPLTFATP